MQYPSYWLVANNPGLLMKLYVMDDAAGYSACLKFPQPAVCWRFFLQKLFADEGLPMLFTSKCYALSWTKSIMATAIWAAQKLCILCGSYFVSWAYRIVCMHIWSFCGISIADDHSQSCTMIYSKSTFSIINLKFVFAIDFSRISMDSWDIRSEGVWLYSMDPGIKTRDRS